MLSRNGVPTIRTGLRISRLVLLLAFCTVAAWSQASTSSVTGQVTDASNAAVAGAEVKLTDVATNASQTAMTNEAGRYIFVNVPSGTYNLIYSKSGFSQGKVMGQKVEVGSVLTLNTTLQVGATSTSIEIKASVGAELQTTNASVGTTITSETLMMLPNMGRDVSTLAVLQPGTTPGGFTAGAYADQNSYTLDGGNNSDDM